MFISDVLGRRVEIILAAFSCRLYASHCMCVWMEGERERPGTCGYYGDVGREREWKLAVRQGERGRPRF